MGDAAEPTQAFREAVENAGHSIYWTDLTGRIEYVNPAFEEQTGYTAEEAVGNNANILQSGVHDARFYEDLWDTILSGEVWEGEIINKRKNGERYVANQTISPVTDSEGEVVRFVAVNEDITELRASQEQLERQRDRFAALLGAVPVPLVIVDLDGDEAVVEQENRALREAFGFTDDDLAGLPLDQFIVAEGDATEAHDVNERLREGEDVHRKVTRSDTSGERRTFLLHATPFGDDGTEALATYTDITDLERTREELRRRTEELEDFANVVSHDLRNPLNVAMGHLDMLADADGHENQHVDTIRSALSRMQELIENILMLARQGRSIDETEPVALAACVSNAWETVDTADATLDVETARTVEADKSRLRQLFANLVRNSVEHGSTGDRNASRSEDSAEHGSTGNRTESDDSVEHGSTGNQNPTSSGDPIEHGGEDVTVTVGDYSEGFYVADDGPGIPEDEREQVFEPGHTSAELGTGLGLSIANEIADAHGWDIDVTESDEGGARFEISGVTFG